MNQKRSADHWAAILGFFLDCIALLSLMATFEIHPWVFLFTFVTWFISRITKFRIPLRPMSLLIAANLIFGVILWTKLKYHPLIAAAHVFPLLHGFIYFSAQTNIARGWRISIGFVELLLATALTTDFYLSISILFFVVIGSVAISCSHLDSELKSRDSNIKQVPLPPGYIRRMVAISAILFLTSAAIYPLLPRVKNEGMSGGRFDHQTNYTEDVHVSAKPIDDKVGAPLLWIDLPPVSTTIEAIHLGLLRGKSLEYFDGDRWFPTRKKKDNQIIQTAYRKLGNQKIMRLDIQRGPMATDVLPTPYGTLSVHLQKEIKLSRLSSGEWNYRGSNEKNLAYSIEVRPGQFLKTDQPNSVHLAIHPKLNTARMKKLADSIFKRAKNPIDKITKLKTYFRENLGIPSSKETEAPVPEAKTFSAIENFLFISKAGHCELFSSAAAILLRLTGIPTRLVAGFRVAKKPVNGVLIVRTSDAHAWIEAWTGDQGWIPLDLTPRVEQPSSVFNYLRDTYDFLSGYWAKFVMTDEDSSLSSPLSNTTYQNENPKITNNFDFESVLEISSLILLLLGLWIVFLLRKRKKNTRFKLTRIQKILMRERVHLERILQKRIDPIKKIKTSDLSFSEIEYALSKSGRLKILGLYHTWRMKYELLRYGTHASSSPQLDDLKNLRKEIEKLNSKTA